MNSPEEQKCLEKELTYLEKIKELTYDYSYYKIKEIKGLIEEAASNGELMINILQEDKLNCALLYFRDQGFKIKHSGDDKIGWQIEWA